MANLNPNRGNLKPWKPGQTGNPGGYSKSRRTKATALNHIEELNLDEVFTDVWVEQIKAGNYQFFREMLDRTEGKLAAVSETESTDLSGNDFVTVLPSDDQASDAAATTILE